MIGRRNIINISIHTLTWRVTPRKNADIMQTFHFNPHPHVEGDVLPEQPMSEDDHFNPHPHVEGDDMLQLFLWVA